MNEEKEISVAIKRVIGIYISVDEKNIVTDIFSSAFRIPEDTDILIEEGIGSEYVHVSNKYRLFDDNLCHNYKYIGGKLVKRTEEEKQHEIDDRVPEKTEVGILQEEVENHMGILEELSDQLLVNEQALVEATDSLEESNIRLNETDAKIEEISDYYKETNEKIEKITSTLKETTDGLVDVTKRLNDAIILLNETADYALSIEQQLIDSKNTTEEGEKGNE